MAKANKRPKWMDSETPELLATLKELMAQDELEDKDLSKAQKIVDELINRQPGEAGPISVDEALKAAAATLTDALGKVKGAYDNEISMMEDSEEEPDEEEGDDEEEEAPKSKKGKGKKSDKEEKPSKKDKKAKGKKKEEPEDDDDEEEDGEDGDDDGEDYAEWATKELKKECRTRGIKVTKSMGKADLVKALEADDKE